MGGYSKTQAVVRQLGVAYHRLLSAMRNGKINPLPSKDISGHYAWTPDDVERARQALARDGRCERKAVVQP